MPTAIIQSTPLDCQVCKEDNCDFPDYKPLVRVNQTTDPKYSAWWAKKYCTMESVPEFVLYYPYALIQIPLIIVLIGKGFTRYARNNFND